MNIKTFAVMGASGQTGSAVAVELLKQNQNVRVLGRDAERLLSLVKMGARFQQADVKSKSSLVEAFQGVDAVYVMNPPNYRVNDLLEDSKENVVNIKKAVIDAGVKKIVVLSSVGSHLSTGLGNIFTTHHLEQELRELSIDVGVIRAGWFMENWKSATLLAKRDGVLPSLLSPLDRDFEMTSTEDIGRVSAESLLSNRMNLLIELAGPERISPNKVATNFSHALNRDVKAVAVAKADIKNIFLGLPPKVIGAWEEMVEGFNSGHIVFEGKDFSFVRGKTSMLEVAKKLVV